MRFSRRSHEGAAPRGQDCLVYPPVARQGAEVLREQEGVLNLPTFPGLAQWDGMGGRGGATRMEREDVLTLAFDRTDVKHSESL